MRVAMKSVFGRDSDRSSANRIAEESSSVRSRRRDVRRNSCSVEDRKLDARSVDLDL